MIGLLLSLTMRITWIMGKMMVYMVVMMFRYSAPIFGYLIKGTIYLSVGGVALVVMGIKSITEGQGRTPQRKRRR